MFVSKAGANPSGTPFRFGDDAENKKKRFIDIDTESFPVPVLATPSSPSPSTSTSCSGTSASSASTPSTTRRRRRPTPRPAPPPTTPVAECGESDLPTNGPSRPSACRGRQYRSGKIPAADVSVSHSGKSPAAAAGVSVFLSPPFCGFFSF
jgi:hypothetical protein